MERCHIHVVSVRKNEQSWGLSCYVTEQHGNQLSAAVKANSLPYSPIGETVERRIKTGAKIKGNQLGRPRATIGK